ncbi:MAG: ABC transporter substrate-binding protein, partial [Leifsonia sp.]
MRMRHVLAALAAVATIAALSGCAGGGGGTASDANSITGKPTGNIKVLTQRTDIVDTVFQTYKKEFEKAYPGVTVTFQAITDYEGDVATMLNTKNYGDVLLIPNSVGRDQLADYFVPLGSVKDLSKTYRFIQEQSFDNKGYGIAITGNAQGILYNKKVWAAAGLTDLPKTPDEFVADLKQIKSNTDATPLYTNYKDGWPMSQWEGNRGILGDPNVSNELTTDTSPWAADKYHGIVDGLLYDVVHDGLTEADPTTTDWEGSKGLLGSGKVGTMVLGSWAITQFQDAAVKAG